MLPLIGCSAAVVGGLTLTVWIQSAGRRAPPWLFLVVYCCNAAAWLLLGLAVGQDEAVERQQAEASRLESVEMARRDAEWQAPPPARVVIEAQMRDEDVAVMAPAEVNSEQVDPPAWYTENKSGELKRMIGDRWSCVTFPEELLAQAKLLEEELKAELEAAGAIRGRAIFAEEQEERLKKEAKLRRSHAWADYRQRLEQLIPLYVEDQK